MSEREKLLAEIEAFLKETGMPHTAFGAGVGNDTTLVTDLRRGRSVRLDMVDKIRRFMKTKRKRLVAQKQGERAASV